MVATPKHGSYAGIRNSEKLRVDVETFIANIRAGVREDQNPLLVGIMEGFLDEAVDALIGGACEAVRLEGFGRRMVEMTVATVKATCHLLSKRVLRNMKNADVRDLAGHMDDLRFATRDADGRPVSYTVVPLGDALHRDIMNLFAILQDETETPTAHVGALKDILFRLLDVCVEHLYVRTLATLRLGPIARKLVEMGYGTVHGGAHTLINRVLPHLSDRQIRDAAGFCRGLVITADNGMVVRDGGHGIPREISRTSLSGA